jgi:hypothetical protein
MPARKHKPPVFKCLSVRQPWASLIVNGTKTVENRSWSTNYRGLLLIHASQKVDRDACLGHGIDPDSLPRGVILGAIHVKDCLPPTEPCRSRWADKGAHHWLLASPRRVRRPVVFKGRVGLFNVPLHYLDKPLRRNVARGE